MATKKKIARSKTSTKRAPKAAQTQPVDAEIRRAAERAGIKPRPDEWRYTGAAFDGGESLRRDTTAADLFSLVFESLHPMQLDDDNLLEAALFNACDDLEVIEALASSSHDIGDALGRFAMRAEYRLKVAHEVYRRMRDAAAAGGAS